MKADIRGYAVFTAKNGFTDNFLDYCVKNGIQLKNVVRIEKGVRAEIGISEYMKLKKAAEKSSCRLHIIGYRGYPVLAAFALKNAGIIIGAFIALALLIYLNGCIWRIEVRGNETLYRDEILQYLAECGVKQGKAKKHIDANEAEKKLSVMLEGRVHWIAVNIEGGTVLVEMLENPPAKEYVPFGKPCNFVADFDGVMESISVKSGEARIKAGSAVKKGDLIISGVITNSNGSTSLYEANGECTAKHTKTMCSDFSGQSFYALDEPTERLSVSVFSSEIPLSRKPTADCEYSYTVSAVIRDIFLPLKIKREIFCQLKKTKVNSRELKLIMCENLFNKMHNELSSARVISRRFSLKDASVKARVNCIERIGVQTAIKTAK